jgi:hypothetical protein
MAALILLLFCPLAYAYKLPDTGQTNCYDSAGNLLPSCADTGQDGQYSINPMSYTDNSGKGTVTDNNTGLVWQKQDDGIQYNWYQATGIVDPTCNPAGENYKNVCNTLRTGDYTDWRLPTKKELITLVDYSFAQPGLTINRTYFPDTKPFMYWSASTIPWDSIGAWNVGFSYGDVMNSYRDHKMYVRCVREGQGSQRFTDNLNGTVTDNKTGLMWQQDEPGAMSWNAALEYCKNELVLPSTNNYTDWRLPNIKELDSLTKDSQYYPAIDTDFFPYIISSSYWSSSTNLSFPNNAWYVHFSSSAVLGGKKSDSNYVRCVRTAQNGSDNLIISAAGTGAGTIVSAPTGINCYSAGAPCMAPFPPNTVVTLSAVPDDGSIFKGWSGDSDCSDGQIAMSADRSCTATYALCASQPAEVGTTPYDSIWNAYAAASSGNTIKLIAYSRAETIDFSRSKNVTLRGGYDCDFASVMPGSATIIVGTITISNGRITVDKITIR